MNMKKIGALILAMSVLGGSTLAVHASQQNDAGTKNVVVMSKSQQNSNNSIANGVISDEKAVEMATKAMKDYMGMEASYFSATNINRTDLYNEYLQKLKSAKPEVKDSEILNKLEGEQKEILERLKNSHKTVTVSFTPADGNKVYSDFVEIDEVTGEIVNVTAINNLDANATGIINDDKVKSAAIDFLKKTGKDTEADLNSIKISNDNGALSTVEFMLKDQSINAKGGAKIKLEVNLQTYSVVHYENYSNASGV